MGRFLLVITRQVDPSEIDPNGKALYRKAGPLATRERGVFVVNGKSGIPYDGTTGKIDMDAFAGKLSSITIPTGFDLGIAIHGKPSVAGAPSDQVAQLKPVLERCFSSQKFKVGLYSNDESVARFSAMYACHRAMAAAFEASSIEATTADELFDKFWLACFGDPILEALIGCLKAQALSMARLKPIVALTDLGKPFTQLQEVQGDGTVGAIPTVDEQGNPIEPYDGLRLALIAAIKTREQAQSRR